MRFGIFDQMEKVDVPLHQVYEDRLELLKRADEAGFWCYFKSEHHLTPLDTAPSISVWLAAVAQNTTNLRIGSLVYLLPFHHPLRLTEEIAMLDHLSGGRLEVGVGRGISPPEHEMWGLEPERARDRSEETLEVLLKAMTTDSLDFEGEFWNFHDVPIEVRPFQDPYPPLWYPGNVEIAGSRGFNTIVGGDPGGVTQAVARYSELRAEHSADPGRVNPGREPSVGTAIRLVIAPTEAEAVERGRRAWATFDHNIRRLWKRAGIPELPMDPSAKGDFDRAQERGIVKAGSPEMIREYVERLADSGVDTVMSTFTFGDLTAEESRESMEFFIADVMPAVRGL